LISAIIYWWAANRSQFIVTLVAAFTLLYIMQASKSEQNLTCPIGQRPENFTRPRQESQVVSCLDCGAFQTLVSIHSGRLRCWRCNGTLERATGRSLDAALACGLMTLILPFPANLLPLLRLTYAGVISETHAASGIAPLWQEGWVLVAFVVALEVVILPFFRFGLLTAALGAIYFGSGKGWIGPAFRWAEKLDPWAMPDVFLIGCAIGYSRLAPYAPVDIEAGGWCMIGAAFMAMMTRASLDRRSIWRRIQVPAVSVCGQGQIACAVCDFLLPAIDEGKLCPRCGQRVWKRKPKAIGRAMALTAAGFLLYPVANIYPMSMFSSHFIHTSHTIMAGVSDLVNAGLWPLACLVFTASIAIPFLKLAAMVWFFWSIRQGSDKKLVFKTELYRIIDEIGRWSNMDVFTIAVFTPMVQFGQVAEFKAGIGAPAFLAVVVFTMIASEVFDSRLIWDASGVNR
jgi:paraquat-inducible protein A